MEKAILISIQPQWVAKILNGEKTIEIRKKFPKDYVGWVYIYCTKKMSNRFVYKKGECIGIDDNNNEIILENNMIVKYPTPFEFDYGGKVVARFWCDKVEEIEYGGKYNHHDIFSSVCYTKSLIPVYLRNASCLEYYDMNKYLEVDKLNGKKGVVGKAIHITNLEIFDKPKELYEFSHKNCKTCIGNDGACYLKNECQGLPLTRAPKSYCYIEID